MPRTAAPPKQTVKGTYVVLNCPVCSLDVIATTETVVEFSPTVDFNAPGSVTVSAEPRLVKFDVSHSCPGPVGPEDTAPDAGDPS